MGFVVGLDKHASLFSLKLIPYNENHLPGLFSSLPQKLRLRVGTDAQKVTVTFVKRVTVTFNTTDANSVRR